MDKQNTKDIIMQQALELFAVRGYADVSMRDIAAAVGIKASSIYYHYQSKQDLFYALVKKAEDIKSSFQGRFLSAFDKINSVGEKEFVQTGLFFLKGYLENPQVELLLQVLECERFHDEEADRVWKDLLIIAPMEHERNVFNALSKMELLKETNIDILAADYQSIITLAYFTRDEQLLQNQLKEFYKKVFK